MKIISFAILLAVIALAAATTEYTVETCKCGEQYQAEKGGDGKVQCVGKLLDHIKACNEPEAPQCTCTKHKVSGIRTDRDGTWCTSSEQGVEKWPCENKDEWDAYKVKQEEYIKTLQH